MKKFITRKTTFFVALLPTLVFAQSGANVQTFGASKPNSLGAKDPSLFQSQDAKIDQEVGAKSIDLRTVLASGLNKNIDQQVREFQREKIELNWDDDFERFWLPNAKISLTTNEHNIETFRRSTSNPDLTPTTPTGQFGLEFGDYSVFNWGRDYLEYLNNKNTYKRGKQRLNEQRRLLRFQIIAQYFNLVRVKNILAYRRQMLRQTSFIHRLARQKMATGRMNSQEYYQTRAEYLRAYTLFQEAQVESIEQDQFMANLLGDDMTTSYRTSEELDFKTINTSINEALRLAMDQSISIRDAKLDLDNSNRSYDKSLKDNMPLPEFKLKLGGYYTDFSRDGSTTQYASSATSRDVELVASINMTWTIFGDGGFFNSRDIQRSYVDKRISEVKFLNTKRELEVRINALFRKIRFLERRSEGSELQKTNAQQAFDSTLDRYVSGKTDFAKLKIAIDSQIESQTSYENAKYEHLLRKLELANSMGLEDFPGANFENLAQKVAK